MNDADPKIIANCLSNKFEFFTDIESFYDDKNILYENKGNYNKHITEILAVLNIIFCYKKNLKMINKLCYNIFDFKN